MFPTRAQLVVISSLVAWTSPSVAQSDLPSYYSIFPVVYFPPAVPVYGAAIEDRQPHAARIVGGRRLSAPDGLADFVGDPFYPALSSRLILGVLKPDLETRLHAYRAKRQEQVNELLNQFVTLHDETIERQEQRLREFARTQTPILSALEAEAEHLRESLIADGLSNRIDWNAGRRWKLGAIKAGGDGADAEAEFQVVRAAAFYQKGLLPSQRGLLRELAVELQAVARKTRGVRTGRTDSDAMFFSPETSRFRLPADLPAALREKVGVYNGRKAELKRELRETVVASEGTNARDRARAFEALADKQWPDLVAMEQLADEIRWQLAPRFKPAPPPPPPWIPSGMMETIRSYNEDRDSYFADLHQLIDSAVALVPRPDLNVPADQRVQVQREYIVRRNEAQQKATAAFHRETAERFALLQQRHQRIRESLAIIAEKQTDRATGRPLNADTLLREYAVSMAEFDTFGRASVIYTNYWTAMLQPGLSPEQRRLLFGYSLIGLAQPLPHGELMPRRSATRPYPSW